jgi:glycosyltransferase involved in cell wall biosynthesis
MHAPGQCRICIVIDAHLSTCPRMLKAADALADAGYDVRVISTRTTAWAMRADEEVVRRRTGKWRWHPVDESSGRNVARWAASGMRMRAARTLSRFAGPRRIPLEIAAMAQCRAHPALVRAAASEPADLIFGGTARGLVAAASAARRLGVPFGLDLEDFHSAEAGASRSGNLQNALARRIEAKLLPRAAFLTAGSAAIANEYASRYGVRPVPVNNTFELPDAPPSFETIPQDGLRLYWFSQTIGADRGLEDAIRAIGMAGIPATLTLRGNVAVAYLQTLRSLVREVAPRLQLIHAEPAAPDSMIALARNHDVGLALEQRTPLNRDLCLTNKAFTYLLAGLAVVFTDTTGQRALADDIGEGGFRFAPGDVGSLARQLAQWGADPAALRRAKKASWTAAKRRWHWEHQDERGALLRTVEQALSCRPRNPLRAGARDTADSFLSTP